MSSRARRRNVCLALLAALALSGCGGSTGAIERLDERSGITLLRGSAPLVFARTEPRYSRSARDYVYVAPVETNRQGVREYYLWVGVATTLDRGFLAPAIAVPRVLYVEVAGAPMELPLRAWSELVPTRLGEPIYATPVPVLEQLAARVSLQQLELIEAEHPGAVRVAADGSTTRRYARWDEDSTFAPFLARVANGGAASLK
jgi:hypothetical protein